jgi:protein gp37
MGDKTGIQWTGSTANPIIARRLEDDKAGFHCVKVSPECAFCYAEKFNLRNLPERGTGLPFIQRSEAAVRIELHRPVLEQVLRWRRPRAIFWCSMTDLFGSFVPSWMIQEVLDVAAEVAGRGFVSQLLTKRPDRMVAELQEWQRRHRRQLPANIWPGFSAGDRFLFLERWAVMRQLVAAPGVVDGPVWCSYEPGIGHLADPHATRAGELSLWQRVAGEGLRWLVWGGESGGKARPFNALWGLAVVRYIAPFLPTFAKQLGDRPFCPYYLGGGDLDELDLDRLLEAFKARPRQRSVDGAGNRLRTVKAPADGRVVARFGIKGGDFDTWPAALQLRRFPEALPA